MILPIGSKSYQTGKCICGMGNKCKAAKAAFRAAGDVRGQVICPPNVSSSSRHQFQKKISDQWMKRTSDHWRTITYKSLHEICNRKDKNNLPLATRTREEMNQQIEKPKQVKIPKLCLSHFHPKVVEKYAPTIPKAITEAEAQLKYLIRGLTYNHNETFQNMAKYVDTGYSGKKEAEQWSKLLYLPFPMMPEKDVSSNIRSWIQLGDYEASVDEQIAKVNQIVIKKCHLLGCNHTFIDEWSHCWEWHPDLFESVE